MRSLNSGAKILAPQCDHTTTLACLYGTVDEKSPDVVAATAFFKKMIRQLQSKSHHHFDATCGFLDKKARGQNAARQLVAAEVIPPIKWKNALTRLSSVAVQMKAVMNRYWVYQHRDIWPAAQPELAVSLGEDSDGSAEEAKGGDDAKAAPVRRVGRKGKRARSPSVHSSESSELEGDDGVLFIGRIVSCPAWLILWEGMGHGTIWVKEGWD